jgi:hypothetical protein
LSNILFLPFFSQYSAIIDMYSFAVYVLYDAVTGAQAVGVRADLKKRGH